jgi:hypothetical protein
MPLQTSSCLDQFGYQDFDLARLDEPTGTHCPVRGCSARLVDLPYGKQQDRDGNLWCPSHGIRLHSGTFVYWNGRGREDESRLRNFIVRPDLVRDIALPKGMKAEAHRLGFEMSEDALSWNVFVSMAAAGRLRQVANYLTGRVVRSEPSLYLWGRHIDLQGVDFTVYPDLLRVRDLLEKDIGTFHTEPDIMLIAPGEMVICIEAKFGSGNPLAYNSREAVGQKPTAREKLLARYLVPGEYAKLCIQPEQIGKRFHSQLFRNIVFACEMARESPWHVVNLVSNTQRGNTNETRDSFAAPTEEVQRYLHPSCRHCFTYRTWEDLHAELIRGDANLGNLDCYLRGKSAHYRAAFHST